MTDAIVAGSATTWYLSEAGRYGLEVSYLAGRNKSPESSHRFPAGRPVRNVVRHRPLARRYARRLPGHHQEYRVIQPPPAVM